MGQLSFLCLVKFIWIPVSLLLYNSKALPLTAKDRKIKRPVEKIKVYKRVDCTLVGVEATLIVPRQKVSENFLPDYEKETSNVSQCNGMKGEIKIIRTKIHICIYWKNDGRRGVNYTLNQPLFLMLI